MGEEGGGECTAQHGAPLPATRENKLEGRGGAPLLPTGGKSINGQIDWQLTVRDSASARLCPPLPAAARRCPLLPAAAQSVPFCPTRNLIVFS